MIKITKILPFFLLGTLFLMSCDQKPKAIQYVRLGTGDLTGLYYPIGKAIGRIVDKKWEGHHMKLKVKSTDGSVYNINQVLAGNLDVAMAQADKQYHAFSGKREWEKTGARTELRSLFSLHTESITIVASLKSGIKKIQDFKGKKINLGNKGSGHFGNALDVITEHGLAENDFTNLYHRAFESPWLLHDEMIDAYLFTVGHPNTNIREAIQEKKQVQFISIEDEFAERLMKKLPFYVRTEYALADYFSEEKFKDAKVKTIGVKASVVSSTKADNETIYRFVKDVFENFNQIKQLHPALKTLTLRSMLQGLTAPVHEGAKRYYKEAGMLKYIKTQ